MPIFVNNKQFHLQTKSVSYIFSVYTKKWLTHLYWGDKLDKNVDIRYTNDEFIFSRANGFHLPTKEDNSMFVSDLKLEFSTVGSGDYREPSFEARYENGSSVTEFEYTNFRIYDGKAQLEGLPSSYEENDAQTLEIILTDKLTGLRAILSYSVFEEYDVIARSVRYENGGTEDIGLRTCMSATVDFSGNKYSVLNLYGDWANERNVEWLKTGRSIIKIDSKRGMSSHMHNPCIVMAEEGAGEYAGEVYSMALVYSGSFAAYAEGNSCGGTRLSIGINPFDFEWKLRKGESFQTPEAILVYSGDGLSNVSHIYHRFIRERICRGKFRDMLRPTVINNWSGTAYNFDEEKLLQIARRGADIGLEQFVLDDGWFGKRNSNTNSLGDWYVNKEKLPGGLKALAEKINGMGLKFGLWTEPEMVSPDSNLYRSHPDWCIHCENRTRTENANQLVLDLSRGEVCDYIINILTELLKSANIEYIKWDCNRNITETKDGEQRHRYMLGLYKILETMNQRFPNVLFESCSGGGGRFDMGMLCYMPQIWTSDIQHAVTRQCVQYGTSIIYPPVTATAHIGDIKVGESEENQFMHACAMTAMAGNFGFELDLSLMTDGEMKQAKQYVDSYKKIRRTVQFGRFYRLENPFKTDFASWMFADKDKAVLFTYQRKPELNGEEWRIKLKGLECDKDYECSGRIYSGDVLMKAGMRIPLDKYEFASRCYVFTRI